MALAFADNPAYGAYISSPEWAEVRRQKLAEAGHRCEECPETDRLEVHHLTYARFGREDMRDLMVLCHVCHMSEHGRAPMIGPIAGPSLSELTQAAHDRGDLEERQAVVLAFAQTRAAIDALEALGLGAGVQHDLKFMRSRLRKMERSIGSDLSPA